MKLAGTKKFFLIGLPGSGKTTVGKILSMEIQIPFLDLDGEVEKKEKKTVSEIFRTDGEPFFREIESHVLQEIIHKKTEYVLSCGGGTPFFFENMKHMKENGITIYLETPWEDISVRLWRKKEKRPLIESISSQDFQNSIEKRFSYRIPIYKTADIIINTACKEKKTVVGEIVSALHTFI
ncbi:MAG: shikimate kinase [Chitinophagaceae bacterium]|nr:shikimate kinase [Chitinophagaceae bacterium]